MILDNAYNNQKSYCSVFYKKFNNQILNSRRVTTKFPQNSFKKSLWATHCARLKTCAGVPSPLERPQHSVSLSLSLSLSLSHAAIEFASSTCARSRRAFKCTRQDRMHNIQMIGADMAAIRACVRIRLY